MTIGERIKLVRRNHPGKPNQFEYADLLGITRDQLANFEQGRVTPPTVVLRQIEALDHVNPAWLEQDAPDLPMYIPETVNLERQIEQIIGPQDPHVIAVFASLAKMPPAWWAAWAESLKRELDKLTPPEPH